MRLAKNAPSGTATTTCQAQASSGKRSCHWSASRKARCAPSLRTLRKSPGVLASAVSGLASGASGWRSKWLRNSAETSCATSALVTARTPRSECGSGSYPSTRTSNGTCTIWRVYVQHARDTQRAATRQRQYGSETQGRPRPSQPVAICLHPPYAGDSDGITTGRNPSVDCRRWVRRASSADVDARGMGDFDLTDYLKRSTEASGVPLLVEDLEVIHQAAKLVVSVLKHQNCHSTCTSSGSKANVWSVSLWSHRFLPGRPGRITIRLTIRPMRARRWSISA